MEEKTLEIQEILKVLKKKLFLIVIITAVCTIGLGAYAFKTKNPSYTATVKIFSGKTDVADVYSSADLSSNSSLIDTYIQLIRTDNFMNKVIAKSGVVTNADHLKNAVAFEKSGDAPIFTIIYTSYDEEIAKNIVSAISTEFETEVKETILNVNTKIIEDAKVITNIPNKEKYVYLGFAIGLILSIGIVLVLDYLDNTIKDKDRLEKITGVPVLGELPKEKKLLDK